MWHVFFMENSGMKLALFDESRHIDDETTIFLKLADDSDGIADFILHAIAKQRRYQQ